MKSNFGHAETRRGDVTTGSYFVALPDGRLQTVVYTVDKVNGYRAKVGCSRFYEDSASQRTFNSVFW